MRAHCSLAQACADTSAKRITVQGCYSSTASATPAPALATAPAPHSVLGRHRVTRIRSCAAWLTGTAAPRHRVTASLGLTLSFPPEGTVVVLASDGIWDALNFDAACRTSSRSRPAAGGGAAGEAGARGARAARRHIVHCHRRRRTERFRRVTERCRRGFVVGRGRCICEEKVVDRLVTAAAAGAQELLLEPHLVARRLGQGRPRVTFARRGSLTGAIVTCSGAVQNRESRK